MFFCQLHDITYLVMCDSYSKWIEVVPMASATAAAVIDGLLRTFAVCVGIPAHYRGRQRLAL